MKLLHYKLQNGCDVYEIKRPSDNSFTETRYDSLFVTAKNMEDAVALATKVGFIENQDEITITKTYTFPEFILPNTVQGKPINPESLEDKTQV
jgi:hypothetical protein